MTVFKSLFYFIFLLFLLASCVEDELDFDGIKTQNWTSEWALPLINSNLDLKDLIKDSTGIIQEEEDGLIVLVYDSEELFNWDTEEITTVPDQSSNLEENFDLPQIPPDFSAEVPVMFTLPFQLNQEGQRVDSAKIKSGFYRLKVRTDLNKDFANAFFKVPSLIHSQTRDPLVFNVNISYQPSMGEIVKDTLFDLTGYTLIVDQTMSGVNELTIEALIGFEGDENPDLSPYYMKLENQFTGIRFSNFFGYAGYQTIEMQDTIYLNLFEINEDGYFDFGPGSVNLSIDLYNSFGLPADLEFLRFTAYNPVIPPDSLEIFLFGEGVPQIIELNYPSYEEIGEAALTTVETVNSNIYEALEISPNRIFLKAEGRLNPAQNPEDENFVLDTSYLKADVSLELKLFGSASGFTIADTVDFEMEQLDEAEYLEFAVDVSNGFPINAEIQLYFVDSVYNELHSLLPEDEILMPAAAVGNSPDYKVLAPAEKITYIELDKEEMEIITNAREIIIRATLSTYDNDLVKIYSDYSIELMVGARFGLNIL